MKTLWNEIDSFLAKLAEWLLGSIVIVILLALAYKIILGKHMMYEDYYNNKVQYEQLKHKK